MSDEYSTWEQINYYLRRCRRWYDRSKRNKLVTWFLALIVFALLVEAVGCIACRKAEAHDATVLMGEADYGTEVWAWISWDNGQQEIRVRIDPPGDPYAMSVTDTGHSYMTVHMPLEARQWLEARMRGYPIHPERGDNE
jgi:hypothetical protein